MDLRQAGDVAVVEQGRNRELALRPSSFSSSSRSLSFEIVMIVIDLSFRYLS